MNVVCCCSVDSGLNSGLRGDFLGFSRLSFLGFLGFCDSDRDHDEQIPRSGRRLIAIRLSVDRDQLEDLGDRDQGLGRIAIL